MERVTIDEGDRERVGDVLTDCGFSARFVSMCSHSQPLQMTVEADRWRVGHALTTTQDPKHVSCVSRDLLDTR